MILVKQGILFFLLLMAFTGCSNYEPPTDAIDCGRQFIDAVFDGNFKRARQLLLDTPKNYEAFGSKFSDGYSDRPSAERDNLRNASIVINGINNLSDSVTVINFLNAFDNTPSQLKLVLKNGEWKVDLENTPK